MKNKISKILGVVLTVALLSSLLVASVPTSAKPLGFTPEFHPGNLVTNTVIAAGIEIVDIAANGDIVYAATGENVTASPLYKSTDGGGTWESLDSTTFFPGKPIKAVAVAADDPDVVGFITDDNAVYYSSNGGNFWDNMSAPSATHNCIDIAPGTSRVIAVGGNNGSGNGTLYIRGLTLTGGWDERHMGGTGANTTVANIVAVKASKNYATDKAILTIGGDGTGACLEMFRNDVNDREWNGQIDYMFESSAAWGAGVQIDSSTATLAKADIAMPNSYFANDTYERLVYIGLASSTSGGGVYRLFDYDVTAFATWSGGALGVGDVGSVSYHESGKLVAGSYDNNLVFQFLEPNAIAPRASRTDVFKQPGGVSKTNVVWSGDTVLAATGGSEGCVAMSTDDGYTFNDTGLISVNLTNFYDVAVNADGSKFYLTTNNSTSTSLWLKEGSNYKRVLSLDGYASIIARTAPDDDSVIYLADTASKDVWVSKNSGLESWKKVPASPLGSGDTIRDLAIESADVAYAIDDDSIVKTENAGASWGSEKRPIKEFTPTMITVASNGDVLVGGTSGYTAYSKDGGSTYERAVGAIGASGNTFVVPDDGYADNNIIYIGSGTGVWRGAAVSSGPPPSARGPSIDSTQSVRGMVQYQGVTYVMAANSTDSVLHKALNLEAAATSALAIWSSLSSGSEFISAPQALKLSASDTTPKLWAIDDPAALNSMTDPISATGPTMVGPADGITVEVNPANGRAFNVNFIFERYSSTDITEAQIEIATDADFDGIIYTATFDISGISGDTIAKAIGPTGVVGDSGEYGEFMPGSTYYWRVRSTTPLYSPWSEGRSFTVSDLDTFVVTGPQTGAADVDLMPTLTWAEYPDAIGYEVMLSEDPTFAIIEWSYNVDNPFYKVEEALKYSTTYYWRVRGVTGEPYLAGKAWVTPAGPWVTAVFTTMAEPVPDEPDVITITEPAKPPEIKVVEVPAPAPVIPTYLLWVIVGVGAVLVIALIVLIVRTRRVT